MNVDVQKIARAIRDHIWGPTGSAIIHVLVIFALIRLVTYKAVEKASEVEVMIMEPDATKLEEFEKELKELEDQPEIVEAITPPDVTFQTEQPPEPTDFASPEPEVSFDALDVRADVASPLIMKGLLAGRSAGGRAAALRDYAGMFGQATEAAVIRALEWLKRNQAADGSWGPNKTAMTGLGLLTFLAHGETTASEQYGQTVEKAIRFLVSQQDADGRFCKIDQPGSYAHAIATYAISEAYGLTRIPTLKPVMEKAVAVILAGQQPKGGWDYNYNKAARRDSSVAAWQIQALKAAYIAGAENAGLKQALDKAVEDIKSAFDPETGRFYYTDNKSHKTDNITGLCVLALQLLGHAQSKEARAGLQALTGANCDWDKPEPWPLYGWYYITQAKFHQGGQTWSGWNAKFARVYVKNQNEDGSWTSPGANLKSGESGQEVNLGPVYSTTLAALTLQVYYRFLPTYKAVAVEPVTHTDKDDIAVEIL